jgi:hypothetical protein
VLDVTALNLSVGQPKGVSELTNLLVHRSLHQASPLVNRRQGRLLWLTKS